MADRDSKNCTWLIKFGFGSFALFVLILYYYGYVERAGFLISYIEGLL